MTTMQSQQKKSLKKPLLAAAAALLLFAGLPFFLSHAEPAAPASVVVAAAEPNPSVAVLNGRIVFRDPKAQAEEFIHHYHTIALTPEQEAIKKAALGPMPAACCRDSSASTCCCPCNLSKTIWGLSNLAISKFGANAAEVKQVTEAWMGFVNPNGVSGDACYRGGCNNAAHRGGCAGMEESELEM